VLRTRLTELLGIEHPIVLAPMGSATSAAFAAAASNSGGLGSIGSLGRQTDAIKRDIAMIRDLTSRPYAVNHIPPVLDEEAFQATLEAGPTVVSFALGAPGDLVQRVHEVGALAMLQVMTVAQAVEGAEQGVDLIVAQGGEAGGYGGVVSTLALVPQVVDAVSPLPVIAAGGIYDGRGLAAALCLGAVGVNLGTRFLASKEAPIEEGWQQAVLSASSEEAIKAEALNAVQPLPGTVGYGSVLRALRSPFLDEWNTKLEEAAGRRDELRAVLMAATQEGRRQETIAGAGQSAGGIKDLPTVAEIIDHIVEEAEQTLRAGSGFVA
jgi:enoyl-[acyl-carrier protein] reductase II